MIKTSRAHLCVDEENRSLALTDDRSGLLDERDEAHNHGFSFDGLNDAIGNLARKMNTYLRPGVLVVDEVGYQPLERAEANLVFQVVSKRTRRARSF